MSNHVYRSRAAVRSRALARNAAHDGLLGAVLGLLLVSGLVVCSLDLRQSLLDSAALVHKYAVVDKDADLD